MSNLLRLMSAFVAIIIILAEVGYVTESSNTAANAIANTNAPMAAPATDIVPPGVVPQDKRVVVNVPAFRMDLFEDGKLIKSYKIGIGYPEFPLPTGLRKAVTIIFNPSWTPPDESWVESPNSKVKVGVKVEAGDKLNPLGPIKIPIGLPSLIHGGKAPAKINGFASHGCVALTSPQIRDFTKWLARLSGIQISDEQIAQYEKSKAETRTVKLSSPVPVELRYETITVEDGKLHIYRDVYARGTNTEENLRNVLQAYDVTIEQLSMDEIKQAMQALNLMARDAAGKPVIKPNGEDISDRAKGDFSAASSNSASSKKVVEIKDEAKPANNPTGKVTSTIKGGKEAIVNIAALSGKGYPSPVDLDAGQASKKAAPRSRRRR